MRLAAATRRPFAPVIITVVAGLFLSAAALAAERGSVLRLRGETAAAEGRCDQALELLGQARKADPGDARAALVSGQCQITLRRYADAVSSLEQAKRLAPGLAEVDLFLGMARYHEEDLAGAEAALEAARQSMPDRAELHLYLGLIALERGQAARAASSLSRSRHADPDAVEPIASFYEGLAREAEGERRAAEAALRRARELGKGTAWETQATAALERLGEGRPPPWKATSPRELEVLRERSPRWWVSVTAGAEYDDNVVLRGTDVRLPEEIGSKDDFRGVWSVEAGYELVATTDWTVGLLASYYGTAHEDLEDFDTHYPGISAWVDRRLRPDTIARFQYDFGYAFVGDAWIGDSDRFLISHTWTPALYHDWREAGSSRLFSRFIKRSFLFGIDDVIDGVGVAGDDCTPVDPPLTVPCGPPGIREDRERDRDGWGFSLGLDHTLPVWGDDLILRAGYRYHYYDAHGTEYSHQGHEAQLGARLLLPFELAFETFASYTWKPYLHRSTYPDPGGLAADVQYGLMSTDRDDDVIRVDVVLERPILNNLTLSARYAYFNDHSNVDLFDYDRHIVGLYATLRLAP